MTKKNGLLLLLGVLFLLPVYLFGEDIFSGLSAGEVKILQNNGTVTRILKNKKYLAIDVESYNTKDIFASISKLNPNYISEVISVIPLEEGKNSVQMLEKIETALFNIAEYKQFPYYSQKWDKTVDLYEKLNINSFTKNSSGFSANVTQRMIPFEEMEVVYNLSATDRALYFSSENISSISYKGVKAVKPGKMQWYLCVFTHENKLVFYGVGAAKAFDMFGTLRSRLEPAFVGRAEAFFISIIKKMDN